MLQTRLQNKIIEISFAHSHNVQHSFKHFSYIVKKNHIISIGFNLPNKTHPLANKFGHRFNSIHSELNAIVNFPYPVKELYHCKMINVRISRNKFVKISKPCIYCQKMLHAFNIGEVWYSNNIEIFERL